MTNFVYMGHKNWNLVLNMMIGIQMSVKSVLNTDKLIQKDFSLKYYFELLPRRVKNMDNCKIYKFYDYAPKVFYEIRTDFKITSDSYLRSIGPTQVISSIVNGNFHAFKELFSSGKSGSFFYFSMDSRYTLKTIP